jgi:cyclohexanone monooxygenase
VYCYTFDRDLLQEWNWSGKFPEQGEILRYLEHVAERYDLFRDIRLGTRITRAAYRDRENWREVEDGRGGRATARFLTRWPRPAGIGAAPARAARSRFVRWRRLSHRPLAGARRRPRRTKARRLPAAGRRDE